MQQEQQRAILTIGLLATFADGGKHEREREQIRRVADSLASDAGRPDLASLVQDVLLKRATMDDAVATLDSSELRQLAYETALGICEADGRTSAQEQAFLDDLNSRLGLADADPAAGDVAALREITAALPVTVAASTTADNRAGPDDAALDRSIINHAVLNGALELLPQSWASMAIIPLQIKMVHGIGKAHGYELDQGHIKEFLAAAGVGLTSQYLEQFGRKLLGGLLGKAAGRSIGKLGGVATGMAFSFASTWALGQVAKRYYAGGRQMSTQLLRDSFQNLLEPAKQMQAKYLPQIEQKAQTLDMAQVMNMVRGA